MFSTIDVQIGFAILLGVFVFALWKGGAAERIGAGFNFLAGVLAMAVAARLNPDLRPSVDLAIDAILASSFLFLAVRYASLWLGGAMLLQAVQFSLHAYYLVIGAHHDLNYATINNLDTYGVMLCIVAGTILSWRERLADRERDLDPAGSV